MRALLNVSCLAACLLFATTAGAQNSPAQAPSAPTLTMADCHPSSFGKLVDVTTVDGTTWRASIRCLDPQHVQLLRDGVVTSTPLAEVRRIVTRPDPVWDGFLKGAAIPLIMTAILCTECLDEGLTYRGALAYGAIGATWDALQLNRKTIYDSGGRPAGATTSVSVPLGRLIGWGGAARRRR
jgi:hypothetical protein